MEKDKSRQVAEIPECLWIPSVYEDSQGGICPDSEEKHARIELMEELCNNLTNQEWSRSEDEQKNKKGGSPLWELQDTYEAGNAPDLQIQDRKCSIAESQRDLEKEPNLTIPERQNFYFELGLGPDSEGRYRPWGADIGDELALALEDLHVKEDPEKDEGELSSLGQNQTDHEIHKISGSNPLQEKDFALIPEDKGGLKKEHNHDSQEGTHLNLKGERCPDSQEESKLSRLAILAYSKNPPVYEEMQRREDSQEDGGKLFFMDQTEEIHEIDTTIDLDIFDEDPTLDLEVNKRRGLDAWERREDDPVPADMQKREAPQKNKDGLSLLGKIQGTAEIGKAPSANAMLSERARRVGKSQRALQEELCTVLRKKANFASQEKPNSDLKVHPTEAMPFNNPAVEQLSSSDAERSPDPLQEEKDLHSSFNIVILPAEEKKYGEVRKWLPAAEQGDREAQFNLGQLLYRKARRESGDLSEAEEWIKKAANQNHAKALGMLGAIAYKDKKVEEAISWYKRSANLENVHARFMLGIIYLYEGKNKDKAKAKKQFKEAAIKGHADAQLMLGNMYYRGDAGKGRRKDLAKIWYKLAAGQQNSYARWKLEELSEYDPGREPLDYTTMIVKRSFIKKLEKLTKAATVLNCAEAQYQLGETYYIGKKVRKNVEQAVKWLTMAAEQGQAEAQFRLGVMYQSNEGVPLNIKKAARLYKKAAKQGHPQAQFSLEILKNRLNKSRAG